MKVKQNYIECAKKNENIFRLILDKYKKEQEGLTIEQIYEKYSEGRRYCIWTILDFK